MDVMTNYQHKTRFLQLRVVIIFHQRSVFILETFVQLKSNPCKRLQPLHHPTSSHLQKISTFLSFFSLTQPTLFQRAFHVLLYVCLLNQRNADIVIDFNVQINPWPFSQHNNNIQHKHHSVIVYEAAEAVAALRVEVAVAAKLTSVSNAGEATLNDTRHDTLQPRPCFGSVLVVYFQKQSAGGLVIHG